ncbi:MAG: carboxypeptidase-like regulatory domain-containing protein, partial [Leptospiraceae bacterium]|nr:carboxypeptidase-like regulatory domain-containing protein [Leptospiraceae bacterium]
MLKELLSIGGFHSKKIGETYVIVADANDQKPQQKGISGRVFDLVSGESLPFATIRIDSAGVVLTSDGEGRFVIDQKLNSDSRLFVQFLGYKTGVVKSGDWSESEQLNVFLQPLRSALPEARIVEDRMEIVSFSAQPGIQSVDVSMGLKAGTTGQADVVKAVQILPGVDASVESSAGLKLRGANSDEVLFVYDGFTIYHVDHLFGVFSALNPESVKSLRLHKGAFESRFGGRNTGIFEITGTEGSRYRNRISVGAGLISGDLSLSVPLAGNKGSIVVNGRRSFTDMFRSPLYKSLFNTVYNN